MIKKIAVSRPKTRKNPLKGDPRVCDVPQSKHCTMAMPEFIEPELRENPNFGGQGHFGGDEYVCAPLKNRKKPDEK